MATVVLEAPDDVDVLEAKAANSAVKSGDVLFRLRSLALEQLALRIEFMTSMVDIMRRQFDDGRIDEQIAQLKAKTDRLHEIHRRDVEEIQRRNRAYEVIDPSLRVEKVGPIDALNMTIIGVTTRTSVIAPDPISKIPGQLYPDSETYGQMVNPDWKPDYDLKQNYEKSRIAYEEAFLASNQITSNQKDALDRLKLIKEKILEYDRIYQAKVKQLTIICPFDGIFNLRIAVGGFARKGHTLGDITI